MTDHSQTESRTSTKRDERSVSEQAEAQAERHPVAVGAAAAGGGAAGAAVGAAGGAIAGPIGAVAGAAIGAILGGLAGKQLAESFIQEDLYFREHFASQGAKAPERKYEDYQPAYRYGWEAHGRFEGAFFEEVEPELQRGWTTAKPSLPWEEARLAAREAWDRRRQRLLDATQQPSDAAKAPLAKDRAVIRGGQ